MNNGTEKIGFVGAGKMASAIISGILDSGLFKKENILASEYSEQSAKDAEERLGIKVFSNNLELVKNVDVVVFCVKPFVFKEVLEQVSKVFTPSKLAVSIVAGMRTETIEELLPKKSRVVRVMPNTPALIKEGMSATTNGRYANEEDSRLIEDIFKSVGAVVKVEEDLIDAVTGVSGSGPAFYYNMIEELAQGGVKLGLDYETSILLSAKTALGAAKMVLDKIDTTKNLMQAVTTKGGTTEVGLNVMRDGDFDKIIHKVVFETAKKAKELGS